MWVGADKLRSLQALIKLVIGVWSLGERSRNNLISSNSSCILYRSLVLVLSHSAVSNSLRPHGLYVAHQAPLSMGFSRQEYWSG